MDKEDLKKSTCINLRCVTQSSKDGVPLNQLQNDYRLLLGVPIPFKDLGYNSLENFLRDIPDVICLKKKADGSLIAEGVADASTAHIAKLISKQKSSKKSKSGSAKPAVVTRTWGSVVKKNSHQNSKSSQKEFNYFPPSSLDRKNGQNSKLMRLTPVQEELKKSVLINLRSVVQSSKDGVPLNRLQNDYRKFIGSNIPIQNLGYSTLYEFVQSIPDVIRLKMDVNEQLIAIGVVDAATAHLFGDPLKPMALKSVTPTVPSKPSVKNKATLQISSEQKTESPSFFKIPQNEVESTDLKSVLKHSAAQKKVKKTKQLHSSVSPLKVAKPDISTKENNASQVSLSKIDTISPQILKEATKSSHQNLPTDSTLLSANTISSTDHSKEKYSCILASENSIEKGRIMKSCWNSTSESNIQLAFNASKQPEKGVNYMISDKSTEQDESSKSSKSSVVSTLDTKASSKKIPDTLCSEKAKEVQNQIRIATISHLVWMQFLLYGPTKVQNLKKEILSFCGFPFSTDSKAWKRKINLISQLPKKVLRQCLCLLCIEYNNKDTKKSLQDKLIVSLAAYTDKSGTNIQETEQEDIKKELYSSSLTLSSVSSDVLSKCSSYGGTETSRKSLDAPKPKCKIVSDSNNTDKQNHLGGSPYILNETKESIQQSNDKGNSQKQKPSASDKATSVLEKEQPLIKKVEQKVELEECSKTETSSIVSSKNTKRKRRRKRKKSELAEKNIGASVTKPVRARTLSWQFNQMKKAKIKKKLLLSSAVEAEIAT